MEDKLPRSSPGSHKQPFHKPWWNQELKEARKLVAKAEQEWLKCSNRITRPLLRAQYREVRRKFDSLVRKTKRKWSNKTWGLLDSSLLGGPQTFWKQLRKHTGLGKKKSPIIPMEVIDGQRILSNKDVLNKWYTDFATPLNTSENPIPSSHTDNASKTEFLPLPNETSPSDMTEEAVPDTIDQDLVKWALLHQKNGKTVGPDGLPAEVIKNQVCCTLFQSLFSACLKNLIIPTVWHHGIITPIPKNKTSDPRIPLNYKGISLLSVPYKAFCSILNQYIMEWIEYSGILCEEQNDFRAGSCLEHIFSLSSIIECRKKLKKPTFACFVNFSKAYDNVQHDLLWKKLQDMKFPDKMLDVEMHTQRKYQLCESEQEFH